VKLRTNYALFFGSAVLLSQLLLSSSWAFRSPDRPPLPPVDKRLEHKPADSISTEQKQAVAALKSALPNGKVEFDELL